MQFCLTFNSPHRSSGIAWHLLTQSDKVGIAACTRILDLTLLVVHAFRISRCCVCMNSKSDLQGSSHTSSGVAWSDARVSITPSPCSVKRNTIPAGRHLQRSCDSKRIRKLLTQLCQEEDLSWRETLIQSLRHSEGRKSSTELCHARRQSWSGLLRRLIAGVS